MCIGPGAFHVAYRHKKEPTNESLTPLLNSRNDERRGYPTILGHIKWHSNIYGRHLFDFGALTFVLVTV